STAAWVQESRVPGGGTKPVLAPRGARRAYPSSGTRVATPPLMPKDPDARPRARDLSGGIRRPRPAPGPALAGAVVDRAGLLHDPRGHHDRGGGDPADAGRSRHGPDQPALGDQRLSARLRGAAADHRAARRPPRAE